MKFLAAVITMLTTVMIVFICLFICYYSKENIEFLKNSLTNIADIYNSTLAGFSLMIFFVFFLEMLVALIIGYTAIIIGHKSNNNKLVKTIVYGFVLYIITQFILLGFIFITGLFDSNIMALFKSNDINNFIGVKKFMYISIISYSIILVIYYLIDNYLLKKGIDVD